MNNTSETDLSSEKKLNTKRSIQILIVMGLLIYTFMDLPVADQSHPNTSRNHRPLITIGSPTLHGEASPILTTFEGEAMMMPYRIQVGNIASNEEKELITEAIEMAFQEVNDHYNRWNSHSELSKLNKDKGMGNYNLSPGLYSLLKLTDQLNQLSDGLFDPTIEVAASEWRQALKKGKTLDGTQLDKIKNSTGWENFRLKHGILNKARPNMQIDLGGIAKGYGVDLIGMQLQSLGFSHIFVEWAGEIRVFGGHPNERAWKIGIKHPRKTQEGFIDTIELSNGAIATSGHSEQYWIIREEGVDHIYSHLIHPKRLTPLEVQDLEIISCTALAPSCALADGLATTGTLFENLKEALDWAERTQELWPETQLYFYTKDDQLWHVPSTSLDSIHVQEDRYGLSSPLPHTKQKQHLSLSKAMD